MLNACDVAAVHLQQLLDTKQLSKEERFAVELGVHALRYMADRQRRLDMEDNSCGCHRLDL